MSEKLKKAAIALLFPHVSILAMLLPLAVAALVYAFLVLDEESPLRIACYVISAYALAVWSVRMPRIIAYFKSFKNENKYAVRWFSDARLRVNFSLSFSFVWNAAYAALQLGLGIYHHSAWFYSLAAYYISLAVMRLFLARHSRKHAPRERMHEELVRYRTCGVVFLIMNLALSVMMFYMVAQNRVTSHNEITTIALAAYTFFTLTKAIVSAVRYRKYESPVFSASKAISLASAAVSMLSLEGGMLATFSKGGDEIMRLAFMSLSAAAVFVFIIVMAIFMIVSATKKLRAATESQM